jgi:peptidoglycan hydrolase CwlO-like protein
MKTLQQRETEAILALGESHELQRETIFRMGNRIEELESLLDKANQNIRELNELLKHK